VIAVSENGETATDILCKTGRCAQNKRSERNRHPEKETPNVHWIALIADRRAAGRRVFCGRPSPRHFQSAGHFSRATRALAGIVQKIKIFATRSDDKNIKRLPRA
jgi:hypothetical protein